MPKKISIIKKREWLQRFEDGDSLEAIRRVAKCNIRTLKSGIQEALMERDAQLARSELVRGALRDHQDKLMTVVKGILGALQPPPMDFKVNVPLSMPEAKVVHNQEEGLVLVLDIEDRLEWGLLQEHLGKGDRLWALLEQWKSKTTSYIQAQRDLRPKAEKVMEEKTGHKLTKDPIAPPFVYSSVVPLICVEAFYVALQTPPKTPLKELITSDTTNGEIRYESSHILAKAPGKEEQCVQNIISAFADIQESNELKKAVQNYKEVREAMTRARRVAEEITSLGIVTGRCRVCRRLGI